MIDPAPSTQLDLAVIDATVCGVLDTLPRSPDASPEETAVLRQAALMTIAALDPATPLQAMLAAQVIAAHYAMLDDLRRAMLPEATGAMAVRLRSNSVAMSRLMIATLRELRAMQAEDAPCMAAPQPGKVVVARTAPAAPQPAPVPAAAVLSAERKHPEPREQPAARPPGMIDPPPEMGRSVILVTESAEAALQARVLAGARHDLRQPADGPAAQAR
jgi:hypothetical protein